MIIKKLIEDLSFELSISDTTSDFDYENTTKIERFINTVEEDYQEELIASQTSQNLLSNLNIALKEQKEKTHNLTKEQLKEVYLMLKNRTLNPKGTFDKCGRFYLDDAELVDVRDPSAKYPYSQMKAGRTSNFVKAIADKYACQTIESLIERFNKAKS